MKANNKETKTEYVAEKVDDGRVKVAPSNQPAHYEFLTEAQFAERFDVITENTETK